MSHIEQAPVAHVPHGLPTPFQLDSNGSELTLSIPLDDSRMQGTVVLRMDHANARLLRQHLDYLLNTNTTPA